MQPVKVLVFKSSPRFNGNSSILAEQVIEGAREAGADVEDFDLTKMYLNPCKACDSCREMKDGTCIINDDMNGLYAKLRAADCIVLAAPLYWFSLPAQMKMFIDRWYALGSLKPHGLRGKKFGLVVVYGDTDPYTSGAVNAFRMMEDTCRYLRADLAGVIYASADKPGEIHQQTELLASARAFGKQIGKRA